MGQKVGSNIRTGGLCIKEFAKKMSTVCIREAVDADLATVLALYAQPEIDDGDVMSEEEAKVIFDRFRSYPNYKLYVACVGSEIIGTFSLLIVENLAHRGAPSGLVEDVVVAVEHQRKGIGKWMMRSAIDRCREAGCYKMALSSSIRRTVAHEFYESLGFVRHGYSFLVETRGANKTIEPTAAAPSACGRAGSSAAPQLRQRPASGGCGSASR